MSKLKERILVGLGEMAVSGDPNLVLDCIGLGSCIAASIYDPIAHVGGMAHMVLPSSEGRETIPSAKYVDMGIPMLFAEMIRQGGLKSRMKIKLAGGARMFQIPGLTQQLNIGDRNTDMVKEVIKRMGLSLAGSDIGGNLGRSMHLSLETGETIVKTVGREPVIL